MSSKCIRDEAEAKDAFSSSDDDFGPAIPISATALKKRKNLPYEKLYVAAFSTSSRYSKSLIHRD
jgi:peptidylprolyl isomerase domain and WD repeat-containing protein 1